MLFSKKNLSPEEMTETERRLELLDIPFSGWTNDAPVGFEGKTLTGKLYQAWVNALTPGAALPGESDWLSLQDSGTAMILRRAGETAEQLTELLQQNTEEGKGGHLLGSVLFVPHPGPEGEMEVLLPPGTWTELFTGEEVSDTVRGIANLRRIPLWCAENALIPVVHPMSGLTLHWFRPAEEAVTQACGHCWTACRTAEGWTAVNEAGEACHLIIRINGNSIFSQ